MNIRICAAIGAIALVVAIGPVSAFACGAGHHSARASTATKVSYVAPATSQKQATAR